MLPQMNDKFDAFVAPARRNPRIWRLIAVLVAFGLLYAAGLMGFFKVASILNQGEEALGQNLAVMNPNSPSGMILLLSSFVFMFLGIWLAVRLFRPGTLAELFGPAQHIPYLKQATLILIGLLVISTLFTLTNSTPNLPFSSWILWALLAIPFLLIQVSAEELVFRGYLLQEVAARTSNRWIWLIVPAIIFGALHYDFETYRSNASLVVLATTIMGFVLSDITIRTGNLLAAIGLHFINNFMAMMIVSLNGSLTGLALFVTKVHVTNEQAVRGLLYLDIFTVLTIYAVYLLAIHWRARQRLQ